MTATITPHLVPLQPFGLRVELPDGSRFGDVDVDELKGWVDQHKVVVLRGLAFEAPHQLATLCRRLGPLQPWSFGAVHELKEVEGTENYLYTAHEVPLHWDGAFADAVPHWLVFECLRAPPSGGETVFVDTGAVLAKANPEQRVRWAASSVRYTTEKKVHYGGSFTSPVINQHPTLDVEVIRYAEPVVDLNPVAVEPLNTSADAAAALMRELSSALHGPDVELAVPWQEGDFVVADNHALLHGRRAFTRGAPRHLYRVNVLDEDRRWWASLRAAWRVRRPEFFRAELPILLIPALLVAATPASLLSLAFLEGVLLFFLLFNVGDMVNCWFDKDIDLHRKTHLSEAISRLGSRSLLLQIAGSALVAAGLALHLGLTLDRPWLGGAGVVGAVLGAGYTAPPLRLKSRGLLQLVAYVGLLFVGPMVMVAGVFVSWPPTSLWTASIAFGVMQIGVLLVNTAEDLDEDEREGVRTAAVVLQARGTIRCAIACVAVGATALSAALASTASANLWPVLLPLFACAAWNAAWLSRLLATMRGRDEAGCREAIRAQGKHVPKRIETAAWCALFVVAILTLVRWS
jgi:alpha-ketoglutarate-dependent taurine dioxygenase/4-hydroxybenzoate polyprenyltransferase